MTNEPMNYFPYICCIKPQKQIVMKKQLQLLCIAMLSIISITAYSQNFYQPIVGGDGNGSETIKGIAGMGGETVFVTGIFTSPNFLPYTGLPTLANNGESNIFVAAYAPQGNMPCGA